MQLPSVAAAAVAVVVVAVVADAPPACAAAEADGWLEHLYDRVATDLAAGRPLVVEAHVALCDNTILRCGGRGLGDGDDLERNLYWATSGGLRGWFDRPRSGWQRVHRDGGDGAGILAVAVWRRRVTPGAAWQRRGITRPFDQYLVAHAWRGTAIDDALDAYVADLYGSAPRSVTLGDGTTLAAGGGAQIVAYVGHNRFMDRAPYDWAAAAARPGAASRPKGTIAVACMTRDYLGDDVVSAARVPLLLTDDFLFAGAHSLEGAVRAFGDGGGYAAIRDGAAHAYADGEKKTFAHVHGAFTNPSDRRWRKRSGPATGG